MNKKLLIGNLQHLTSQLKFDKRKFLSEYPYPHKRYEEIIEQKINPDIDDLIHFSRYFKYSIDQLLSIDIKARHKSISPKSIKMLVLDVDGVMTNAGIIYTENGDELKVFNAKDGLAIKKLTSIMPVGILSNALTEKVIEKRARVLNTSYFYSGNERKMSILNQWLKKEKIKLSEVAYIGDDLNDAEIFDNVGLTACPADAVDAIKSKAQIILKTRGGRGCIREFIDEFFLHQ
jgi:3-deoxy-D-manno-octulosonate 8-phosphate phosphatase (KDO 8-P phosphatase)